jgi:hypothetical protein
MSHEAPTAARNAHDTRISPSVSCAGRHNSGIRVGLTVAIRLGRSHVPLCQGMLVGGAQPAMNFKRAGLLAASRLLHPEPTVYRAQLVSFQSRPFKEGPGGGQHCTAAPRAHPAQHVRKARPAGHLPRSSIVSAQRNTNRVDGLLVTPLLVAYVDKTSRRFVDCRPRRRGGSLQIRHAVALGSTCHARVSAASSTSLRRGNSASSAATQHLDCNEQDSNT